MKVSCTVSRARSRSWRMLRAYWRSGRSKRSRALWTHADFFLALERNIVCSPLITQVPRFLEKNFGFFSRGQNQRRVLFHSHTQRRQIPLPHRHPPFPNNPNHTMNHITRILIATVVLAPVAFGAKSANLAPAIAKPGTATVDESFAASELGKLWTVAKGNWQVRDGVLV